MDEQYGWICEYLYGSVVFKKKKKKITPTLYYKTNNA